MRFRIVNQIKNAKKNKNRVLVLTHDGKGHIISRHNWFIDIKDCMKSIVKAKSLCIDARHIDDAFIKPIAFAFFKYAFIFNMYKTTVHGRNKGVLTLVVNDTKMVDSHDIQRRLKSQLFGNKLATEPANKMYPELFCSAVENELASIDKTTIINPVKVKIMDTDEMTRIGLNLILSVGNSSAAHPPRFLIVTIGQGKQNICLVGKGVVFDSGGYDLKATMTGMKGDKAGGALVVSVARYFACHALPRDSKLVILVPLVENLIGQSAYKSGDVFTSYSGLTVEIANTDAEGRMILADALSFACAKYKPILLLDFATLTGWASRLHCDTSFVFYTQNNELASRILATGDVVGERSIRMPNWPEYMAHTKSKIADLKNADYTCGAGGGFMATMFLANFIPENFRNVWAHFDMTHTDLENGTIACNGLQTAIELIASKRVL